MNVFDLIREKLEERIEHCLEMRDWRGQSELESAIEIVNQIEQEVGVSKMETDGWIPVEERLPDSDRYILLHFANFTLPAIGRYEEDEEGGAFYIGDEDETCVQQDLFVNAWMELPERYTEN